MADTELLRTFLAIYRAGSLTGAAYHRGISQPAASQHLAALERATGARLFVRGPAGVIPTERARQLYAQVSEPLDALEAVIVGLRAGKPASPSPPVRLGSSPEYLSAEVLPRLAECDVAVNAFFGKDSELLSLLEHGELDLAVTSTTPARRSLQAVSIGAKRFMLVAAPRVAPTPLLEWRRRRRCVRSGSLRTGCRANRGPPTAWSSPSPAASGRRCSSGPSRHGPGSLPLTSGSCSEPSSWASG